METQALILVEQHPDLGTVPYDILQRTVTLWLLKELQA